MDGELPKPATERKWDAEKGVFYEAPVEVKAEPAPKPVAKKKAAKKAKKKK